MTQELNTNSITFRSIQQLRDACQMASDWWDDNISVDLFRHKWKITTDEHPLREVQTRLKNALQGIPASDKTCKNTLDEQRAKEDVEKLITSNEQLRTLLDNTEKERDAALKELKDIYEAEKVPEIKPIYRVISSAVAPEYLVQKQVVKTEWAVCARCDTAKDAEDICNKMNKP